MAGKAVMALSLAIIATTCVGPAQAASYALPDLEMARLYHLAIDHTADGRRLLRFTMMIVNTGLGAFELGGQRADAASPTMAAQQHIYNRAGGWRVQATPAVMIYAGDGHDHWHVRDLEDYQLRSLDGIIISAGTVSRSVILSGIMSSRSDSSTGVKSGFCFADGFRFDTKRPGAPARAVYSYAECGKPTDLSVRMGLSVGWGDPYLSTLPDQYVDITGLPWGTYRLEATADASNWFHEGDESNNTTWVDIRLTATQVTILGYGPSA